MDKPIIVYPPDEDGRRRVTIRGGDVGKAADLLDVTEFMRRAGIAEPDPIDPDIVDWRGAGPEWA